MSIKNIVSAFALASAAFAYGASSQTATAPAGKDNFAIGYGAGYKSGGVNTNVVCIGTDAGMNSSNNTDCVFIGGNAGKWVENGSGVIQIGRNDDTRVSYLGNLFTWSSSYGGWAEAHHNFRFENDAHFERNSYFGDYDNPTLKVETNGLDSSSTGLITAYGVITCNNDLYINDAHSLYIEGEEGGGVSMGLSSSTNYFNSGISGSVIELYGGDLFLVRDQSLSGCLKVSVQPSEISILANDRFSLGACGGIDFWSSTTDRGSEVQFSIDMTNGVEIARNNNKIQAKDDGIYVSTTNLNMTIGGKVGAYLAFDSGALCVYTNGVKIGTMTFTPAQ